MNSLEKLMEACQKQMELFDNQLDGLSMEKPEPHESISIVSEERETWSRMYWDAHNRYDEVEGALMLVLKDFNRR